MTFGARELGDAYASLADPNGLRFYGTAQAIREVAKLVRQGSPAEIGLAAAPDDVVESGALRVIRVFPRDSGPIELSSGGKTIEITGGLAALTKLAATLENLANTAQSGGPVPVHVDLEYFSGHGFLGEGSKWMTITLLPEPSV